jgi:hypothetical protein
MIISQPRSACIPIPDRSIERTCGGSFAAGSSVTINSVKPAELEGLKGGGLQTLEAAGLNLGAVTAGFQLNFALQQLMIHDGRRVRVTDDFDSSAGPDVVYVSDLTVGLGSTLDLNGRTVYYRQLVLDPTGDVLLNGGALIQVVPEPSSCAGFMGCCFVLMARLRRCPRGMRRATDVSGPGLPWPRRHD